MLQVSEDFTRLIFQSHRIATKVCPPDRPDLPLPLINGDIALDITAAVRGTASLKFAEVDLVPRSNDAILAPYGQKLQVFRGLYIPGVTQPELVSLGKFVIQRTRVRDTPGGGVEIDVSASDRSQNVIDAEFEDIETVGPGDLFTDAILEIVGGGVPIPEYEFIEKDSLSPTLTGEQGDDRWAFAQTMASALGCDLYYNNQGILTLSLRQIATDPHVLSITEGVDGVEVNPPEVEEDPSLLEVDKELSRENAHNKWIVNGDNPDDIEGTPPTATAIDDDPDSPTRYGGPFGKKPEIWNSAFITDNDQAQDAAEGKKAKERGISLELNFGSLVHPALEPDDVVFVKRTRKSRTTGEIVHIANESHVLDSLNIPLMPDQNMTGKTRAVFVESLEEE